VSLSGCGRPIDMEPRELDDARGCGCIFSAPAPRGADEGGRDDDRDMLKSKLVGLPWDVLDEVDVVAEDNATARLFSEPAERAHVRRMG